MKRYLGIVRVWGLVLAVTTLAVIFWNRPGLSQPAARQPHDRAQPLQVALNAPTTTSTSSAAVTPIVGTPKVIPAVVSLGTSTQVTVTSLITGSPANPLISGSVNLLRRDATGKVIANLGVMHDDGLNGDAAAGDKVSTLRLNVNETAPGEMRLQVSAAFRGLLLRVLSPTTVLNIWPRADFSQVSVTYPPTWSVSQASSPIPSDDPNVSGVVLVSPANSVLTVLPSGEYDYGLEGCREQSTSISVSGFDAQRRDFLTLGTGEMCLIRIELLNVPGAPHFRIDFRPSPTAPDDKAVFETILQTIMPLP